VIGLPSPAELRSAHPAPPSVGGHRDAVADVIAGRDHRLLVVVGPCSVHDTAAALDYAGLLAAASRRYADDLLVVMRAYLEKPRTVAGWTGFVPDPSLDGTGDIAGGLRRGRAFLADAAATGLPLAYEFVDPTLAPHVADLVSWGAIGARTVASQPHRHLASWLDMPIGMKNCVSGGFATAVDAVRAARLPHAFPGIGPDGRLTSLRGTGNPDTHLVLRGGPVPNYDSAGVAAATAALTAAGLPPVVVVDASHGNSGKDHNRQPIVIADLATRIAGGDHAPAGVMIESYLADGGQPASATPPRPDLSITDSCLGWDRTAGLLDGLAIAARRRGVAPAEQAPPRVLTRTR
jgi:3-deoxy-7-phosphoheptulonate synthase